MNISLIIRSILFLILFTWLSSCDQAKDNRPNVIIFLIDDFGYGEISYEGNKVVKTPGIDRIAKEGIQFTRFYQSAGACAPTRAALLTGRDYLLTGVWGVHWGRDFMHLDENTLGNLFQSAGYKTGAFGKWHSGKTWAYYSWNRGFDVSVHPRLYNYYNTKVLYNNKIVKVAGPIPDVVGDQAIKFIKENKDNPFFCYVPFQSIHGPYDCPEELFQKFKSMGFSDHVARAFGMTEKMDENVGRILETLDQEGLTENTIVMFMVDDGPSPAPDRGWTRRMNQEEYQERKATWAYQLKGGKASIWEGGERSPCYMRWPGKFTAGKKIEVISGVLDVYPTLAEICNIPLPENQKELAGRSLLPWLRGEQPDWTDRSYFDNTNLYKIEEDRFDINRPRIREMSVQHQDFKYVKRDRFISGQDTIEHYLYNLKEDQQETTNLALEKPDITQELKAKIDSWYSSIISSGRAFKHTVYQVGHWQERGSPLNLDGASEILGSLERDPGGGFYFTNWTEPGNGLRFRINVVEGGNYQIELIKRTTEENNGAIIAVSTEHDRIQGEVGTDESNLLPEILHLPQGEQTLTVELVKTGASGKAMDWLDLLVLQRIPATTSEVLVNTGIEITSNSGNSVKSAFGNETVYFLYGGQDVEFQLTAGEAFSVESIGDNLELLERVEFFLDFESVYVADTAPFNWSHQIDTPGNYTLNAEFTDVNGIKNSSRLQITVN